MEAELSENREAGIGLKPLVNAIQYPVGFERWILVLTAISCAVLELIDTTIVNVALREISGNIGATQTEIAWVVTSYGIANVIIIPLSSMLSNLFGRKIFGRKCCVQFIIRDVSALFPLGNQLFNNLRECTLRRG